MAETQSIRDWRPADGVLSSRQEVLKSLLEVTQEHEYEQSDNRSNSD